MTIPEKPAGVRAVLVADELRRLTPAELAAVCVLMPAETVGYLFGGVLAAADARFGVAATDECIAAARRGRK